MVNKVYEVVWTKSSQKPLKKIYEYISEDSPQNALIVIEDIILSVNKAIPDPEFYNPDKYKVNNDSSYRAFEKHHYRIAYRFTTNIIRVLRIRHTSREPHGH